MLSVFFQTEESLVTAYGVCHIVGKYLIDNNNPLMYILDFIFNFLVKGYRNGL